MSAYLDRHASPGSDVAGAEIVFSELLTNAIRHAPGPIWVSVDWAQREPVVTVHDLGPGFDPSDLDELPPATGPGGRGLYIASRISPRLTIAAKRGGGTRASAVLPVTRPVVLSFDPPPPARAPLPRPEEASDGAFGRESFLRALVVQLAQAVESREGPAAAERAVTEVGAVVGAQIEEAHRAAQGLAGRLTPRELGDLYVRLKAAIDGDFSVVEADEQKIVLVNTRCPFGDAVKSAPGLCRMTSSVFGGIAARNSATGSASVVLEERIAVGDPGCRVVVWLVPPPESTSAVAHFYASGVSTPSLTARPPARR